LDVHSSRHGNCRAWRYQLRSAAWHLSLRDHYGDRQLHCGVRHPVSILRRTEMSVTKSGVKAHDDTCNLSEEARQVSVKAAANQAAVVSAEVTHYRNCIASARANGVDAGQFLAALRELGFNS